MTCHAREITTSNRVKKVLRKQGTLFSSRVYIDGVFEHLTESAGQQNTVHLMDQRSRMATIRLGNALGDTTPAIKYELENNISTSLNAGLNSSAVLLDVNGTLVNSQDTRVFYARWASNTKGTHVVHPFGETSFGSYGKKRYQYNGKERDEETALYYYGARYYHTTLCRFVSVDPLAQKFADLSPYNYAGNKPIAKVDIDGLQEEGRPGTQQSSDDGGDTDGADDKIYDGGILPEVVITGVKELTEKDIDNMGAGTEFSLFKAVTNYENYSKEEDFRSLGTYTKNPIQSNEPYHPNPKVGGDRKTYYNDLFIANENYNFSNFASVTVGNLISGEGPENTVFGKDHSINQFMQQTDIVREAVGEWKKNNSQLPFDEQGSYNEFVNYTPNQAVMDLLDSFLINRDFTTPEQVIGGANVEINPLADGLLEIKIFNVTSIGSGNIENGKSYMRQPGFEGSQAYRNVSQTFIFNYQWR